MASLFPEGRLSKLSQDPKETRARPGTRWKKRKDKLDFHLQRPRWNGLAFVVRFVGWRDARVFFRGFSEKASLQFVRKRSERTIGVNWYAVQDAHNIRLAFGLSFRRTTRISKSYQSCRQFNISTSNLYIVRLVVAIAFTQSWGLLRMRKCSNRTEALRVRELSSDGYQPCAVTNYTSGCGPFGSTSRLLALNETRRDDTQPSFLVAPFLSPRVYLLFFFIDELRGSKKICSQY